MLKPFFKMLYIVAHWRQNKGTNLIRRIKVYKILLDSIFLHSNPLEMPGDKILIQICKYVAEYEQMWKWIIEFLSKFQGGGIKIDRVNSIRVARSMIFFNILRAVAR